jgi:YihY family inner membrane protein
LTTASSVPETYELEGDEARETLSGVGGVKLIKDSFTRFRTADGFSHVRALAHAMVLTVFPVLITVIGLTTALQLTALRKVLEHALGSLAPGPSGRLLNTAFREGAEGDTAALVGGLIGAVLSATFALAQVERGCNRVYGMVRDRTFMHKLRVAFVLSLTAGLLMVFAFMLLAAGGVLGDGLRQAGLWSETTSTIFAIARWPVGLLATFGALTLMYKFSPNRRQPAPSWLQTATIMATVLWFAFTALLALYYSLNERLGTTYGPLLGVIAILTWAYATALALYLGIAFAAQLEAVRAGVPGPRTLRRHNEEVRNPRETDEFAAANRRFVERSLTPPAEPAPST